MNSVTLKENGFAEFIPLKTLHFSSLPSDKACVFALADSTLTPTPDTDILYIGRSKKPAKRIFGGYLGGYGRKTTRKINSKLMSEGYLEKVTVSWMPADNPKAKQQELLDGFKKEHSQSPSWNGNKKTAEKQQPPKPKASTKPRASRKKPAKPAT
jgi:hypothetical protein